MQKGDTLLEGELKLKWCKLVDELEKTALMVLPRCYFVHIRVKVVVRPLHVLCDAFVLAYAAEIYLVITTTTPRYATFFTAKPRVALNKKQAVPRLELLSTLFLARLMKGKLTVLRSQFWIVKGRQSIRNIINECATCRKQDGQAYSSPAHPQLPDYRVKEDFLCANTGIDFAGTIF